MRDTILFDLDETLLDRTRSLRDFALWQARGMLRNSIGDEHEFCERFVELDANGSIWKDKVYSILVREFGIEDWSVDELLSTYTLGFCGFCRIMPNAQSALENLRNMGFRLGIVSNGKSPFQERNFNALGIKDLFESVVVSEAVGYRKPDPEIFLIACNSLNTSPEKSIFVGDNPETDITGANKLGMHTVYIPGYYGRECKFANSTCDDFAKLVSIVETII